MDSHARRSHEISSVSDRTPRPLDGRSLGFALGHELNVLRDERPYRDHGHNARTLLKNDGFRTVLVVLKPGARLVIPMRPGARALNVTQAAAMVLGEALRQTGLLPG